MRVVLVNPPSPEALGAPLLGQQYVAAAFLAAGCEVIIVDAAAGDGLDVEEAFERVRRARPDVVGVGLFTRWIAHAYRLVERLRSLEGVTRVAGGAHATVRPHEVLARGFDLAVVGEAEGVVPALVDALRGRRALAEVPGLVFREPDGAIVETPTARWPSLDTLPSPLAAQPLYDPAWYGRADGEAAPDGILTSRGCPARCTFCANYVTGRGFRARPPADVVAELEARHARTGATFFAIWDDSFTASRRHVEALCHALRHDLSFAPHWTAIMRADRVTRDLLATMRAAGCTNVMFGAESGDDDVLRAIRKGISTAQVERSLQWAKEEGLTTAVSIMLGFPEDTPETLANTHAFLERIAPDVDAFSTGGVVIPFPGTPVYDAHHEAYGFTDWWLDERYAPFTRPPPIDDVARFTRWYLDDANLAANFFRYDDATRAAIRACLVTKGEHNLRRMGLTASVA